MKVSGGRVDVAWRIEGDLARGEAKLIFLLLLCLEAALPWGGTVTLARLDDRIALAANGERLRIDEALWSAMSEPQRLTDVIAADVQFALVPLAAARLGRRVFAEVGTGGLTLTF